MRKPVPPPGYKGYKFYFTSAQNKKSFRAVKINHKNLVK